MSDSYLLPPAQTTYRDWVGTAAAENSMLSSSGDLYVLAGLDMKQWTIVAVNASAHSHGKPPVWDVEVYAVSAEVAAGYDDRARVAESGPLPVRQVHVHGVGLDDIIRCLKVIEIQLVLPERFPLSVVETADFPEQV